MQKKKILSADYSVVATVYNDEKSIGEFIDNIITQTVPPKEIIIADGGSKDSTVEILNSLSKNSIIPIVVLSGKRLNIAEGFNAAIKSATYDLIGVVAVGNKYSNNYFELLLDTIMKNESDGAFSPVRGYDANGFSKLYNKQLLNGSEGSIMEYASNHGVLLKKSIFYDVGFFYEGFIYAGEDTEFYKLVKEKGYILNLVKEAISLWDTPKNIYEFKKQIRVYTIASLQIDAMGSIKCALKYLLKLFLLVSCIVALAFSALCLFGSIYSILIVIFLLFFLLIMKNRLITLRLLQIILQIFYTMANLKYAKEEYRVKR